jgi:hypothetical protein
MCDIHAVGRGGLWIAGGTEGDLVSGVIDPVSLQTLPIVQRKDEARYGEYRTKRRVVREFEKVKNTV